jgi:TRAP-type transport system periplasmic protein
LRKNCFVWALCIALVIAFVVVGCTPAKPAPAPTPTTPTTPTPAPVAAPITWKFAIWVPPQHTSVVNNIKPWSDTVTQKTDGGLKFTLFPGSALGKAEDHYDLVVKGTADIAIFTQSFTPGRFPLTAVTELPFVVTTTDATSRTLADLYREFPEIQKEYADTHPIFLSINGGLELYTTKKAVRTLDDIKGLTIRASGQQSADMLKALGATPILMPMTDLYTAMQKGTVDGCVALYEASMSFKLQEVSKYVTEINLSTVNDGWTVNKDSWNKLPANIQQMIDFNGPMGCDYVQDLNTKAFAIGETTGLKLLKDAGVEIIKLSPDEMAKWRAATNSLTQAWISQANAKGAPGQKIYDETLKLIKKYTK